jgi:hypothetical protein
MSFTIGTGLKWTVGQQMLIAFDANNTMTGTVTAYDISSGALTVTITASNGSGAHSTWVINILGAPVNLVLMVQVALLVHLVKTVQMVLLVRMVQMVLLVRMVQTAPQERLVKMVQTAPQERLVRMVHFLEVAEHQV